MATRTLCCALSFLSKPMKQLLSPTDLHQNIGPTAQGFCLYVFTMLPLLTTLSLVGVRFSVDQGVLIGERKGSHPYYFKISKGKKRRGKGIWKRRSQAGRKAADSVGLPLQ
ncbi:hypothetical protein Peur_031893 [Populus x canadensis]